jgi:hypothetical protein
VVYLNKLSISKGIICSILKVLFYYFINIKMIYMYGLPGRKAYTELGDVLDVNTLSDQEAHGYDFLKQVVKNRTDQFMKAQYAARRGSTISNCIS